MKNKPKTDKVFSNYKIKVVDNPSERKRSDDKIQRKKSYT